MSWKSSPPLLEPAVRRHFPSERRSFQMQPLSRRGNLLLGKEFFLWKKMWKAAEAIPTTKNQHKVNAKNGTRKQKNNSF